MTSRLGPGGPARPWARSRVSPGPARYRTAHHRRRPRWAARSASPDAEAGAARAVAAGSGAEDGNGRHPPPVARHLGTAPVGRGYWRDPGTVLTVLQEAGASFSATCADDPAVHVLKSDLGCHGEASRRTPCLTASGSVPIGLAAVIDPIGLRALTAIGAVGCVELGADRPFPDQSVGVCDGRRHGPEAPLACTVWSLHSPCEQLHVHAVRHRWSGGGFHRGRR